MDHYTKSNNSSPASPAFAGIYEIVTQAARIDIGPERQAPGTIRDMAILPMPALADQDALAHGFFSVGASRARAASTTLP